MTCRSNPFAGRIAQRYSQLISARLLNRNGGVVNEPIALRAFVHLVWQLHGVGAANLIDWNAIIAKGHCQQIEYGLVHFRWIVDESQVVVDAADLKDLLPAQAELLVPVSLGAVVVAVVIFLAKRSAVPAILDITI